LEFVDDWVVVDTRRAIQFAELLSARGLLRHMDSCVYVPKWVSWILTSDASYSDKHAALDAAWRHEDMQLEAAVVMPLLDNVERGDVVRSFGLMCKSVTLCPTCGRKFERVDDWRLHANECRL